MPVRSGCSPESRVAEIRTEHLWRFDCQYWTTLHHTTYRARIISWIKGLLWMRQLSITITEFGPGKGSTWSSKFWMNMANVSAWNDPSTISQCRIPFSKDMAGSTENLREYKYAFGTFRTILLLLTAFHAQKKPFAVQLPLEWPMHAHDMLSCDRRSSHQQKLAGWLGIGLFSRCNLGVFQQSVLLQHASSTRK